MENINWLALIIGALVPMIMGFIWYNPKLFGNAWMKSLGYTEDDFKDQNMPVIFGVSFVMALVLSFFVISMLGIHNYFSDDGTYAHNFGHGAYHGIMLAIMMAVPVLVTNSLFEKRNWTNILINVGYWIATIAIMGGVVSLFLK